MLEAEPLAQDFRLGSQRCPCGPQFVCGLFYQVRIILLLDLGKRGGRAAFSLPQQLSFSLVGQHG